MHMYNFLCSDSLLYIYFFLFLSTLHGVYTRDCSCNFTLDFIHYLEQLSLQIKRRAVYVCTSGIFYIIVCGSK